MCGCDWNYVCAQHRGTSKDWKLEPLPDYRLEEEIERYESQRVSTRPSLSPES